MKGAIFDMDGTLLDSMQVWVHVGEQYLRNRGIEPEEGLGDVLFHEHAGRSCVCEGKVQFAGSPRYDCDGHGRDCVCGIPG